MTIVEELVHIACATEKCGHTICMKPEVQARYRRTHETYRCPAGHANYYPAETDEEKDLRRAKATLNRWRELWDRERAEHNAARKLARTCPLCGMVIPRTRRHLPEHLRTVHGAVDAEISSETPA